MLAKSPPIVVLVAVFVSAGVMSGCATQRPSLGYDELWMPAFERLVPAGALIDRIVLTTDCVGLAEVRNLPDVWSMQGTPQHGENYRLELSSGHSEEWLASLDAAAAAQLNKDLSELRFKLRWRGQWSDCASWTLTVHAFDLAVRERVFEYRFEPDRDSETGQWRQLGSSTSP